MFGPHAQRTPRAPLDLRTPLICSRALCMHVALPPRNSRRPPRGAYRSRTLRSKWFAVYALRSAGPQRAERVRCSRYSLRLPRSGAVGKQRPTAPPLLRTLLDHRTGRTVSARQKIPAACERRSAGSPARRNGKQFRSSRGLATCRGVVFARVGRKTSGVAPPDVSRASIHLRQRRPSPPGATAASGGGLLSWLRGGHGPG